MKLTAPRAALIDAVSRAVRVADSRSTMPILANVLLTADGQRVTVSATDLYLSTQTVLDDCNAPKPGTVALPARDLLDRLKAMPPGDVKIESSDDTGNTSITSALASRRYKLHGVPGAEFPTLPEPGKPSHTIPAATLLRLLAETHYAISTDETRLHLNSLLVDISSDGIRCVATDGHRLAMSLACISLLPLRGLVPLKGVLELRRVVEGAGDGEIALGITGPSLFVRSGATVVGIKLADAQFPPWRQVVPESTTAVARCSRAALADACRAVSLASSERTGGVKLTFASGKIRIESESPESGEGFDEIAAECDCSQTIGVNARYLLDVCAALECDEIAIGVSGELDPVKIAPVSDDGEWVFDSVVMPMRV